MSVSFSPIGGWMVVGPAAAVVLGLTLWVYRTRLRGTSGRWRWAALALRLLAILFCLTAALRPSLLIKRKTKIDTSIIFLIDSSKSMTIMDQASDRSRWDAGKKVIEEAKAVLKRYAPGVEAKFFRFDS